MTRLHPETLHRPRYGFSASLRLPWTRAIRGQSSERIFRGTCGTARRLAQIPPFPPFRASRHHPTSVCSSFRLDSHFRAPRHSQCTGNNIGLFFFFYSLYRLIGRRASSGERVGRKGSQPFSETIEEEVQRWALRKQAQTRVLFYFNERGTKSGEMREPILRSCAGAVCSVLRYGVGRTLESEAFFLFPFFSKFLTVLPDSTTRVGI